MRNKNRGLFIDRKLKGVGWGKEREKNVFEQAPDQRLISWHDFSADDGELFMDDCNLCTCFSGEVTCTKRQCPASVLSPEYNASESFSSFSVQFSSHLNI